MKKFIYESTFSDAPDASKKQQMLFATDVQYAITEGYDFIESNRGKVFKVSADNELIEVDVTEEALKTEYLNKLAEQDDDDDDNDDDEDEDITCNNIQLIDQILNNTLNQFANITPEQIDIMLKLGHLKTILMKGIDA